MIPDVPNPCPLCGGTLEHYRHLTICASCHGNLLISSSAVVAATGEFAAVSEEAASRVLDDPSDGETRAARSCTWCGKTSATVKKMLQAATGASICNECVAFCAEVLTAELGDDWR